MTTLYSMNIPRALQAPQRRQGFTLIELLTVMAVIAVLAGVTSMTVLGLQTPGARQGAMLQTKQLFEEARMTAIEQRSKVYVAFADASHPDAEKRLCAHLLFREYSTEEIAAMPSPPPANSYKAITGWNQLPKGFYIDAGMDKTLLKDTSAKMNVAGLPGNPATVYAVTFGSLGQVVKPQSALQPLVVMPAEFVDETGALKKLTNSEANAFCVQLNRFTGRVKTYEGLPAKETSTAE